MKILLLGDLSPTAKSNPLFKQKDTCALLNDTVPLFKESDICFINLECALTDSANPIKKFGPPLKACAETAEVFTSLCPTVFGLSNNHIFDYGKKGVSDTMAAIEKADGFFTGFGDNYEDSRKNYVYEKNGERICFIAVCEHEYSYALSDRMGSRPYDEYETMYDIRQAKNECDRVIVLYHGGKELCRYPSPRLVKLCRAMVRNGADVVLCQHTHCIGCCEDFEGGHILYGQGNFHFVGLSDNDPSMWNESLAVKYDTKSGKVEFVPFAVKDCGIELAKGTVKQKIESGFKTRNQMLKNGTWQEGWREFCKSVAPVYIEAAQSAAHLGQKGISESKFAHYLDCEAHTDVWRELFKTANHRNEL